MPANFETQEYKLPAEPEDTQTVEKTAVGEQFEIEIEDDTPEEDRNRTPMPKPLVEELEKDELDRYDDSVKEKLKQMRKVWHDERRAKEEAYREQQEAVRLAQKLMDENKRIKGVLDTGGKEYAAVLKNAASLELDAAKREYREAYDAGDADRLVEAQQKLNLANFKILQAQNFTVPSLQEESNDVQRVPEQTQTPVQQPVNPKLAAWQNRNPWYGRDEEMTASALGLHEKLKNNRTVAIGSDEYFAILDKTIRKRFPEHFEAEESESNTSTEPAPTKPSTVVAPAVRSTASNKVRLKASQVALAKKLGLTPEQYAIELRKLEARNG